MMFIECLSPIPRFPLNGLGIAMCTTARSNNKSSNIFLVSFQDLLARIRQVDSVSTDSQGENDDISVLLCHLGKVPIVGTVFRRLDPAKDARAFVEQWVFSGA